MSAVASQNVSQGLYRLSGWDGTDEQYHVGMAEYCPAYDLGYLLRKLPGHIGSTNTTYDKFCKDYGTSKYASSATFQSNVLRKAIGEAADTPEDAAAKLAIELFKQGILVKEDGEVRG